MTIEFSNVNKRMINTPTTEHWMNNYEPESRLLEH